jgi:tetratricopeptide (TPR) repeat protein
VWQLRRFGVSAKASNSLADGGVLLKTASYMRRLYGQHGFHSPAVQASERDLERYERTLGNCHPSTLDTVHNMALVFNNQGQYEKALKWYGRALDGREKTLRKDHPSTLDTVVRSVPSQTSQWTGVQERLFVCFFILHTAALQRFSEGAGGDGSGF